jgi:hypothetical protein
MRAVTGSYLGSPPSQWLAPGQRDTAERPKRADERAPGRSLMVLPSEHQHSPAPKRSVRPSAVFLAQLIATALAAPQTRARRRVEPGDAQAAYAAAATSRAHTGRAYCRTI